MMKDNGSLGAGVAGDSVCNNCFGDGVYQITVKSGIIYLYITLNICNCTLWRHTQKYIVMHKFTLLG